MVMTPSQAEPPEKAPLMTLDEVGDFLRLGRDGVRALIDNGQLPVVRLSPRVLRVEREELMLLIERSRTTHGSREHGEHEPESE